MRYLIIVLSVLALTACGETIMLSKMDGEAVATGKMKFRPNPPHSLTVILDGKTYEGDVDSHEVDDDAHLRERFGANSKHYKAIFLGFNTTHHVHHYKGTLKAPDGATLACEYLSSSGGGVLGLCEDGKGQAYEVHK